MSRTENLPPHPGKLLESMRDLGYQLETALADLVDNSISAHATKIEILLIPDLTSPSLIIMDNGIGMDESILREAMRMGSRPDIARNTDDLGRYGLGMKAASLSQCCCLTVITRQADKPFVAARWDLTKLADSKDWTLEWLSEDEIAGYSFLSSMQEHGTAVVWEKLDRLIPQDTDGDPNIILQRLDEVRNHLALIFHRFLGKEDEGYKPIQLLINGDKVEGFSPFAGGNEIGEDYPMVGKEKVGIKAYVLPHPSFMLESDRRKLELQGTLSETQGFYIYRNRRLLKWGGWLKLQPPKELTKLARVKLDFASSQDSYWSIDVKKSTATVPSQIKMRVKELLRKMTTPSVEVIKGRGKQAIQQPEHWWERQETRYGPTYRIRQEHPVILSFSKMLTPEQQKILSAILYSAGDTLPLRAIYVDQADAPHIGTFKPEKNEMKELRDRLVLFLNTLQGPSNVSREDFCNMAAVFGMASGDATFVCNLSGEIWDEHNRT